jgi:3-deoxy-manno-octulosonate cytidylyltransferase (CMP-KDO synthetase)
MTTDPADPAARPIIVIPARLSSLRLPNKPLALIGGVPMVVLVWQRAMAAALGPVVVAACDDAVADAVRAAGGTAVMTDPDLPSGSDRVHAALHQIDPRQTHDVVVNLQGDLPTVPPAMLRDVLLPLAEGGFDLGTLVADIASEAEAQAPSVVKAVCGFAPGSQVAPALYFSRAVAPWGEGPLYHHIGLYAWRRDALARFVSLPPSPLEMREKLEQLRALEAGMRIGVARASHAPFGIDTPSDLARVRAEYAQGLHA